MSYQFWKDAQEAGRKLWDGGDKAIQEVDRAYVAVKDSDWTVAYQIFAIVILLVLASWLAQGAWFLVKRVNWREEAELVRIWWQGIRPGK